MFIFQSHQKKPRRQFKRNRPRSFIVVIMLTLCSAQTNYKNVIFTKEKEIAISRSQWKLAFVMELDSYSHLFDHANVQLNKIANAAVLAVKVYHEKIHLPNNGALNGTNRFLLVKQQLERINQTRETFFNNFLGYNALHTRIRSETHISNRNRRS